MSDDTPTPAVERIGVRAALAQLLADIHATPPRFCPDDILTHEWLYRWLGFEQLRDPTTTLTVRQHNRLRARYASAVSALRHAALEEAHVYLDNEWGRGYRWVPAARQTDHAFSSLRTHVHRALRRHTTVVNNVDVGRLTEEEFRRYVRVKADHDVRAALVRRSLTAHQRQQSVLARYFGEEADNEEESDDDVRSVQK